MSATTDRRATGTTHDQQLQRSLTACWKEGVFAQMMIGIVDYYVTPLALFLGASNQHIGMMAAIPSLLASISQFFAVRAVTLAGDRRRLLVYGVFLQSLFLLPVGILVLTNLPHRIEWLIALVALHRVLGAL